MTSRHIPDRFHCDKSWTHGGKLHKDSRSYRRHRWLDVRLGLMNYAEVLLDTSVSVTGDQRRIFALLEREKLESSRDYGEGKASGAPGGRTMSEKDE